MGKQKAGHDPATRSWPACGPPGHLRARLTGLWVPATSLSVPAATSSQRDGALLSYIYSTHARTSQTRNLDFQGFSRRGSAQVRLSPSRRAALTSAAASLSGSRQRPMALPTIYPRSRLRRPADPPWGARISARYRGARTGADAPQMWRAMPLSRTARWTSPASRLSGTVPPRTARAAASPATWPVSAAAGISRVTCQA